MEGCIPFWGELGPHLTQCGPGRGLSACEVSSWSVQPFGHNTSTSQTGQTGRDIQTDRQDNGLIAYGEPFTHCRPKTAQHSGRRQSSSFTSRQVSGSTEDNCHVLVSVCEPTLYPMFDTYLQNPSHYFRFLVMTSLSHNRTVVPSYYLWVMRDLRRRNPMRNGKVWPPPPLNPVTDRHQTGTCWG